MLFAIPISSSDLLNGRILFGSLLWTSRYSPGFLPFNTAWENVLKTSENRYVFLNENGSITPQSRNTVIIAGWDARWGIDWIVRAGVRTGMRTGVRMGTLAGCLTLFLGTTINYHQTLENSYFPNAFYPISYILQSFYPMAKQYDL